MNEIIYQTITSSTGYEFIQATDSDGKVYAIPTDPANSDYAAYLASLEETAE